MNCPNCKNGMELRRFVCSEGKFERFIYECFDCSIIMSPVLVILVNAELQKFENEI